MAGQTPIWKKEIRLRSKPPKAAAEAPVDAHKQGSASIWKKDLTLRSGKSKEKQPVEAAATSEIEAAPGHGSIWKRDLRIRRSVPKSRPSSEIDSILAPAVELDNFAPDGTSGEADDGIAEPNEISSALEPKAAVLVPLNNVYESGEPAEAAEKTRHSWFARPAKVVEFVDDLVVDEQAVETAEPVHASWEPAGSEGLPEESDSLADELQEHTHLHYGASVELSAFTAPAEEDAPLEELRGARPDWGSTGAVDNYRYLDANEAESPAGAVDSAPDAFGPRWLRSEDDVERPASFALGVDEPLETEKETETRFSDVESNLEHSDLDKPAELWSKPWTPELSDPGDSDQESPDSVAEGLGTEEVDAHVAPYLPSHEQSYVAPYLPSYGQSVTDEPEEARASAHEGDSLSASEEPELPFARTDSALESSSGDPVASSYRELGFVPESPAFASSLDQVTAGEDRDDEIVLPETDSSDWLTALGDEEVSGASGPAAIDVEPDHDSSNAQQEVSDTSVIPVPYFIPDASNDESDEPDASSTQSDEATTTAKEPKKSKFRRELKRSSGAAGIASRPSTAEVVGVRIGSSQIVAAVVRNTPGIPELAALVSAPIEHGIVVAGEVREPDALAAELKTLFAKNKLPRKRIRLGIASSRVGVRIIEVPAIDDPKLLENAIRFRAQEVVSIPLSDAILDHFVVGNTELDGAPAFRVLLAFAHRDLVDRYVEAFKKARLKVTSVDFEAFALLRAVTSPEDRENADRATVALAVGQERTIFAVAEGDVCDFTRVLEWGGGSLTVAVARALNMTPSQAEPVKRTLSFGEGLEHPDLDATQVEAARVAMQRELQVLARELLTSLQFYQSRPGSLAIGEVLITGGGIELEGTAQELQERLGVPVRLVDPFERLRTSKKAKVTIEPGATTIAIGLGLEA